MKDSTWNSDYVKVHTGSERTDPIPTRPTLLARLKNWEDDASWRYFFETYWRLIFASALKSGLSEEEAEDVVQETVLSVAQTMPKFQYDPASCSFKTWLLHLTHKRIVDQFRKRAPPGARSVRGFKRPDETSTVDRVPDPSGFDLERVWDEEWRKNLTAAAMQNVRAKVCARHYQIFDLYVTKGWSVRDVARTLHVSVGQVYLAKHRVLGLLKKERRKLERQAL